MLPFLSRFDSGINYKRTLFENETSRSIALISYTIICEYACLVSVTRGMSSDGFIIIDSLYDFNAMKTVCVLETLSGCPEGLC